MPTTRRRAILPLALVLLAAGALSGCFEVRENSEPLDETVNNGGTVGGSDEPGAQVDQEECVSTTTGEPTTHEAQNPCPQGQYPRQE